MEIKSKALSLHITAFIMLEIVVSVYTLLCPKIYRVEATILSPEAQSPAPSISTPYGTFPAKISGTGQVSSQAILALLNSRRLATMVVDKFKLDSIYKTKNKIMAGVKFKKNFTPAYQQENGVIILDFMTKDPGLGVKILNFILSSLDSLNTTIKLTTTRPIVKVIDKPIIPAKKYKPHLSINLILGFLIFLSIEFVYFSLLEIRKII